MYNIHLLKNTCMMILLFFLQCAIFRMSVMNLTKNKCFKILSNYSLSGEGKFIFTTWPISVVQDKFLLVTVY